MKYRLVLLFIFTTNLVVAQQWDNLNRLLPTDTLLLKSIQKADSMTLTFQSKANSLNAFYQSQFSKIDSAKNLILSRIDSLISFNLSTEKLTKKLDSLNQAMNEKISSYKKIMDDLKEKATQDLNGIQLPPQLQEPMQKLKSSIDGYSFPSFNTHGSSIPSVDMSNFVNTQLPTPGNQLNLDTNLGNITGNLGNINEIAGKAGEYTRDAQHLVKGNLNEVKHLDETMEAKLTDMAGVDQLKEGQALLGTNPMDSAALADKAKSIVKEQVMNVAMDHFSGKQEVLEEAMSKMTKLKNRYSEVQNIAELPKRLSNPLKGKPFIERIVPALTFQVQKSNYLLLDVNPMLMYLVSPHISIGAGWSQRLPFDDDLTIKKEESIYGPRVALEVKWTKGINFRLLPEIMNTTIPPLIAQSRGVDPVYREWISSLFFGIKKDFTLYKLIKGNTEVLYNLYDPDGMSPYGDKLSVRFGFEFPMKKK